MSPNHTPDTGVPWLLRILGGLALLIAAVTLLIRLMGPAAGAPPPPPAPVALDTPAEVVRPPRVFARRPAILATPARPAAPATPVAPATPATPVPPPALRLESPSPPKALFADECADVLFQAQRPSRRAYDISRLPPDSPEAKRFSRAGEACACIERVYRHFGITDLRGEDARSTYEAVLTRHGLSMQPKISLGFDGCEHMAR